jgi:hypothetical protein
MREEPELLIQPHDQIARSPAHHAMDRRDRTFLHDAGEKGLVHGVELGRHSWRRDIDETVRSLLVEPDHRPAGSDVVGTAWSSKRYLNIGLLKDQQMRAAITT